MIIITNHKNHNDVLAFGLTVSFLENYPKEVNQQREKDSWIEVATVFYKEQKRNSHKQSSEAPGPVWMASHRAMKSVTVEPTAQTMVFPLYSQDMEIWPQMERIGKNQTPPLIRSMGAFFFSKE